MSRSNDFSSSEDGVFRIPHLDPRKFPLPDYYWISDIHKASRNIIIYVDQYESTYQRGWESRESDLLERNNYSQHFLGHNASVYQISCKHFANNRHNARVTGFVGDSVMIMLDSSVEAMIAAFEFADEVVTFMDKNSMETTATIVDGLAAELNLVSRDNEDESLGRTTVGPAVDLAVRLSWIAQPNQVLVSHFTEAQFARNREVESSWSLEPPEGNLPLTLDKWRSDLEWRCDVYVVTRNASRSTKAPNGSIYPQNLHRIAEYLLKLQGLTKIYTDLMDASQHGEPTFIHTIEKLTDSMRRNIARDTTTLLSLISPIRRLLDLPVPVELSHNEHPAHPHVRQEKARFNSLLEKTILALSTAETTIAQIRTPPIEDELTISASKGSESFVKKALPEDRILGEMNDLQQAIGALSQSVGILLDDLAIVGG